MTNTITKLLLTALFPCVLLLIIGPTNEPKTIPKLEIEQCLLSNPMARPQKLLLDKQAIVLHYTANLNADANADFHQDYFDLGLRKASYHYIVDAEKVMQLVPDGEVAFHCGGIRYTERGKSLHRSSLPPNYTTIGVGMCVNKDFDKVVKNTYELISELWTNYGYLPLLRHYDITGKLCPQKPIGNELHFIDGVEWEQFKTEAMEYHQSKFIYQ